MKKWRNSIQNIDCMDGLRSLRNESIDLIITDPPYGISRELNCKGTRLGSTAKLNFDFGKWDVVDKKFMEEWFNIAVKKTNSWMISFCAKKDIGLYWDILLENKFVAIDVMVWQKPDPIPFNAKTKFLNAWEAAIIGKRPGGTFNGNYIHNIFKYQAPKGKDRFHPTQKPVGLIEELIIATTKKGGLVLDPFMGSGTTAIACMNIDRNYIGFEIDRNYYNKALKRIKMHKKG